MAPRVTHRQNARQLGILRGYAWLLGNTRIPRFKRYFFVLFERDCLLAYFTTGEVDESTEPQGAFLLGTPLQINLAGPLAIHLKDELYNYLICFSSSAERDLWYSSLLPIAYVGRRTKHGRLSYSFLKELVGRYPKDSCRGATYDYLSLWRQRATQVDSSLCGPTTDNFDFKRQFVIAIGLFKPLRRYYRRNWHTFQNDCLEPIGFLAPQLLFDEDLKDHLRSTDFYSPLFSREPVPIAFKLQTPSNRAKVRRSHSVSGASAVHYDWHSWTEKGKRGRVLLDDFWDKEEQGFLQGLKRTQEREAELAECEFPLTVPSQAPSFVVPPHLVRELHMSRKYAKRAAKSEAAFVLCRECQVAEAARRDRARQHRNSNGGTVIRTNSTPQAPDGKLDATTAGTDLGQFGKAEDYEGSSAFRNDDSESVSTRVPSSAGELKDGLGSQNSQASQSQAIHPALEIRLLKTPLKPRNRFLERRVPRGCAKCEALRVQYLNDPRLGWMKRKFDRKRTDGVLPECTPLYLADFRSQNFIIDESKVSSPAPFRPMRSLSVTPGHGPKFHPIGREPRFLRAPRLALPSRLLWGFGRGDTGVHPNNRELVSVEETEFFAKKLGRAGALQWDTLTQEAVRGPVADSLAGRLSATLFWSSRAFESEEFLDNIIIGQISVRVNDETSCESRLGMLISSVPVAAGCASALRKPTLFDDAELPLGCDLNSLHFYENFSYTTNIIACHNNHLNINNSIPLVWDSQVLRGRIDLREVDTFSDVEKGAPGSGYQFSLVLKSNDLGKNASSDLQSTPAVTVTIATRSYREARHWRDAIAVTVLWAVPYRKRFALLFSTLPSLLHTEKFANRSYPDLDPRKTVEKTLFLTGPRLKKRALLAGRGFAEVTMSQIYDVTTPPPDSVEVRLANSPPTSSCGSLSAHKV